MDIASVNSFSGYSNFEVYRRGREREKEPILTDLAGMFLVSCKILIVMSYPLFLVTFTLGGLALVPWHGHKMVLCSDSEYPKCDYVHT